MLLHAAEVIQELCIPVGQSSEERMEGKNKDLREVRQHYTCKTPRIRINKDLIPWLLILSDPKIASHQKIKHTNRRPLYPDVVELVQEPRVIYGSDMDNEMTVDANVGAVVTDDSE